MGRKPCCSAEDLKRGTWTAEEDRILKTYIKTHGGGRWRSLPKKAGLKRCGKSCRLRWLNYLRPDIKRGNITHEEEDLIIRLHKLVGNRWSLIAGRLPGRTDNEIKNYWNTHLRKKLQSQEQQGGCNPETTTTMMFSNLQHILRENREGNLVTDQLVIGALTTDEPPELVSIESFTPQEENWWDVLLSLDAGDASAVVRSPQFNIVSLCGDESSPCKNNATDDDHNNHIFENWMSDPTQYNFDLELESVANFLNCH